MSVFLQLLREIEIIAFIIAIVALFCALRGDSATEIPLESYHEEV